MPDVADFPGAMGRLRRLALGLAPQGVTSKLVIPGSQILYLELDAPGPDAARRRTQIAAALEGRTPYAVADLVFDWSGTGKSVQVAVVARETLAEAEAFAEQHGFSPVSFVALPEPGTFAGEPFFGLTSTAAQHLPEGSRLDRDQDPIRLVQPPAPSPDMPPPPPAPAANTPDVSTKADVGHARIRDKNGASLTPEVPAPAPATVALPQKPAASARSVEPAKPAPGALPSKPDQPEVPAPSPTAPHPETPKEDPIPQDPLPKDPPPEAPQPQDPPYNAPPSQDPPIAGKAPTLPQEAIAVTGPDHPDSGASRMPRTDRAPQDARHEQGVPGAKIIALPDPQEDLPGRAASVAPFVSRRKPISANPDSVPSGAPRLGAVPARNAQTPADAAPKPSKPGDRPLPTSLLATSVLAPDLAIPDLPQTGAATDGRAARKDHHAPVQTKPSAKAGATFRAAARSTAAIGGAASKAIARDLIARINTSTVRNAAPAMQEADPGPDPAPSKTVFGGQRRLVRNKPRYLGLMLTAALVLFMGIVALWSSILGNREAPQTVSVLARDDLPTTAASQPSPVETALESAPETAENTATPPADVSTSAATDPAPETAEASPPASAAPSAVTPPALDSNSGVWGAVEPQDGQQPGEALVDLGISPTDPAPVTRTGSELPPIGTLADDPRPAALPEPVPYDRLARIAPDGLLQPTPQGVIAPGGFTLYAGRPPRIPRERPKSVIEAALAASRAPVAVTPASAATNAKTVDPEPYFDPALAGRRPVSRPKSIKPPAAPTQTPTEPAAAPLPLDEGAILSPADKARYAALQAASPRARPAAIKAAAASALAAQKAEAAAAAALEQSLASASPQAVSVSRRPANRPRNFSGAVEAALALAVASEPAAAVAAPARIATLPKAAPAAPQHEEIDEPEPVAPTPKVPTSASVAKQATQKNALNMGKINLIGLYGSSGNRRALVRLANGKFVKVEVGDKLDGGRVTGIGDGQLTYQKNGKSLLLKLLKDG